MFFEDLHQQQITPIISLDLLHLCRKGQQTLRDQKAGGVAEVLGIMGSSPLLLYRFLEWQQEHIEEPHSFSLTKYLLRQGPEKHIAPHHKNLSSVFSGQLNYSTLYKSIRDLVLAHLPEAFSSQFDPRHFKRAGFIPFSSRLPQIIEIALNEAAAQKGPHQLSDQKEDLVREIIRKLRRHLEDPIAKCFEEILARIERQAHQVLGRRGMESFLEIVISKVSFMSLLGLARGSRGDHLYLLNLHAIVCSQLALLVGQKLHGPNSRPLNGLPSPEDLFVMALIHDLGQALMITHFPEVHADIWEILLQQESQIEKEQLVNPKTYSEIEKDVLIKHRFDRYSKEIEALPKAKLQLLLERIIKDKPQQFQVHSAKHIIQVFTDIISHGPSAEGIWAQNLWKQLELPPLTPIKNSCELASHLLIQSAHGQEFVKGAYDNYARFVRAYGEDYKEDTSLSVLFIRYINHLTSLIAQEHQNTFPCVYSNIGEAEVFEHHAELAERLSISPQTLQDIAQKAMIDIRREWQFLHPLLDQSKSKGNPLTHPQKLQNDLQLQISDFFKKSEFFRSGYLRFTQLSHQIMQTLNNAGDLTPQRFVSELENALRHFFRVLEVVIKPRRSGQNSITPEDHFAVLFQNAEFGDELACFHYRHLIADFYILDPQDHRVRHPEVEVFMRLFCDHLLLNYSSEIWELFKEDVEIARLDIARQIVQLHRLGDGLGTQLLYLKARLLDGLLHRFSQDLEPKRIYMVQFAIFKDQRQSPLELFPTADFDYWKSTSEQSGDTPPDYLQMNQELADQLNLSSEQIKNHFSLINDGGAFELTLSTPTGPLSVLCLSLFEMDECHTSRFLLLIIGATQRRDGVLVEALIDKGVPQELSRHKVSSEKPVGLTLMQYFASDDSSSALSRLTHLRPSRLKEMGLLVHQVQREVRHLMPKLPEVMRHGLSQVISESQLFWDKYHHELSRNPKLSKETLQAFDALRKKSDTYKKSIRMRLGDLTQLLQNLPNGSLGKLRLADPLICLPWGLETLYLSHNAFTKFRDSVDRKIQHGHPQLRTAAELLHRLESAWIISHHQHLQHALITYFEELSREPHILNANGPVSCSLTLFLYDEQIPHFPESKFSYLCLECFVPGPSREGAHQRMVASAGGGYNTIFRDEFLEFSAIAHRNVIKQKNEQFLMECFFRSSDETPSLRYVEPHMQKYRFFESTGVGTLFFFPCRSQNLGRQQHHGF